MRECPPGWRSARPARRRGALAWGLSLLLALACGSGERPAKGLRGEPTIHAVSVLAGPHDVARIDLGDLGVIRVELLPEVAPKSVAYFTQQAQAGTYDGTYFHRVIPDFMIQGGDPNTKNLDPRDDGLGCGGRIEDEFSDYSHVRGTVALANTGYRNSNGCQFFIVHADTPQLDGSYNVIGRVVEGMEVVDAITQMEIDLYGRYGPPNRPYPANATIEKVTIEPGAEAAPKPSAKVAAAGAG